MRLPTEVFKMAQGMELLTSRELAKHLRVKPETVRDWARRGRIPVLRLSPKVIRYNADAVIAALLATPVEGVSHGK